MISTSIPEKYPGSKTTITTCMKNSANSESDSEEQRILNSNMNSCSNNYAPSSPISTKKINSLVKSSPNYNKSKWTSRKNKPKALIGSSNSSKCKPNLIVGNKEPNKLNTPKCKSFSRSKISRPCKLRGKFKHPDDNSATKKKNTSSKSEVSEKS